MHKSMFASSALATLRQWLWPRHLLAMLALGLVESERPWLKRCLIRFFLARHRVELGDAVFHSPYDYASFNAFFTRTLKPGARPVCPHTDSLASPVDGHISQCGHLQDATLIQAKGHHYNLSGLLADAWPRNQQLSNGSYAVFYLAPSDYHRVHMPLAGKLVHTTYVPGRLFSLNPQAAAQVPDLYTRNERLVCEFESTIGRYVLVLIGAGFVSGIVTRWSGTMPRGTHTSTSFAGQPFDYAKGEELAWFRMGSTVLVLLPENSTTWDPGITAGCNVRMGERLAHVHVNGGQV